jgi:hypothetical protein
MSIDTGSSGNIFSGQYFDLNLKHLRGQLPVIHNDVSKINKKYTLKINSGK